MKSTYRRRIAGVGLTITKANLADLMTRRVISPEKTPEQVAEECCGANRAQPRHVARAARLMHGGT